MRKISVAAVQLRLYPHSYPMAVMEAERSVRAAANEGARLICLPEHWLLSKALDEDNNDVVRLFSRLARELGVYVNLGAYYERRNSGRTYLTSVIVSPAGEPYFRQDKVHLYRRERRVATPGSGFGVCSVDGFKVAVLVCHDAVFPESARAAAMSGAELLIVPSLIKKTGAVPWLYYLRARALENRLPIVAPNIYHPPRLAGGSLVIDLEYDRKEHVMNLAEKTARGGSSYVLSDIDMSSKRAYRRERLGELRPEAYR